MTDLIAIYITPDFWFFNKESIALAIVLAFPTGLLFSIGDKVGDMLWIWLKSKLKR